MPELQEVTGCKYDLHIANDKMLPASFDCYAPVDQKERLNCWKRYMVSQIKWKYNREFDYRKHIIIKFVLKFSNGRLLAAFLGFLKLFLGFLIADLLKFCIERERKKYQTS